MIIRYRVLTERLRVEVQAIDQVVNRVEQALSRADQQPQDRDFFLAAVALDLHGFYAGVERIFEMIANEVDGSLPKGPRWHRDLLEQMSLTINEVRPAVLQAKTQTTLIDYLEFRHVVRNVYTFDLRSERVAELGQGLPPTFTLVKGDLLAFAKFLENLSQADEKEA